MSAGVVALLPEMCVRIVGEFGAAGEDRLPEGLSSDRLCPRVLVLSGGGVSAALPDSVEIPVTCDKKGRAKMIGSCPRDDWPNQGACSPLLGGVNGKVVDIEQ